MSGKYSISFSHSIAPVVGRDIGDAAIEKPDRAPGPVTCAPFEIIPLVDPSRSSMVATSGPRFCQGEVKRMLSVRNTVVTFSG